MPIAIFLASLFFTTPVFAVPVHAAEISPAQANVIDSITSVLDSFASTTISILQEKKAGLEKSIQELHSQELATKQTTAGQRINEAVGDDSFVPATRPTGTPAETFLRIAKQLLLLAINIAIYILSHRVLYYITLAILALILLRLLWRMIGRQQF